MVTEGEPAVLVVGAGGHARVCIEALQDGLKKAERAGAIHVLYGSSSGLGQKRNQLWHLDSAGVKGKAKALDDLGYDEPSCCVPTTCAAEGANCGSIPDGCGGTLSCGTCTLPASCGGAGIPNQCGFFS